MKKFITQYGNQIEVHGETGPIWILYKDSGEVLAAAHQDEGPGYAREYCLDLAGITDEDGIEDDDAPYTEFEELTDDLKMELDIEE